MRRNSQWSWDQRGLLLAWCGVEAASASGPPPRSSINPLNPATIARVGRSWRPPPAASTACTSRLADRWRSPQIQRRHALHARHANDRNALQRNDRGVRRTATSTSSGKTGTAVGRRSAGAFHERRHVLQCDEQHLQFDWPGKVASDRRLRHGLRRRRYHELLERLDERVAFQPLQRDFVGGRYRHEPLRQQPVRSQRYGSLAALMAASIARTPRAACSSSFATTAPGARPSCSTPAAICTTASTSRSTIRAR